MAEETTQTTETTTKTEVNTNDFKLPAGIDSNAASAAITLYNALQDPDTGHEIIETLARKAGLLEQRAPAAPEKGEAVEKISVKLMKKALGKDYDKFSETIGPVLEEVILEHVKDLRKELTTKAGENTYNDAVEAFVASHETNDEIEREMTKIMSESPPASNLSGKQCAKYLERMYKAACDELGVTPKGKEDTRTRLREGRGREDEPPKIIIQENKGPMTIDQAIEFASKGIRVKRRDE